METVRAFVAIDVGDKIGARLDALQCELQKIPAAVRWVNPSNIHLTLAFLGERPAEQIKSIKPILEQAVSGMEPFELKVGGSGFFGHKSHPRIIWAGVDNTPTLMALQSSVGEALDAAGLKPDRKPFAPHLTLGRIKGSAHMTPLLEQLEKHSDVPLGHTYVDSIHLYKSVLSQQGAVYTELYRMALKSNS